MMTHKIIQCYSQFIDTSKETANSWKLKGLSDESIKPTAASNNSLASTLNHINTKIRVKFNGSYLKLEKVTVTHKQ